jgi:hypothetical protein
MSRFIKISFIFMLFSLTAHAEALVNCDSETWSEDPAISDGFFTGTLMGNCTFTEAQSGKISALYQNFLKTAEASDEVHGSAASETYDSMPAKVFDVTNSSNGLTLHAIQTIATDSNHRAVCASTSQDIEGGTFSGLTKKLDVAADFSDLGNGSYNLQLTTHVVVKQMSGVPTFMFMKIAKSTSRTQFEKNRDSSLPDFTKILSE